MTGSVTNASRCPCPPALLSSALPHPFIMVGTRVAVVATVAMVLAVSSFVTVTAVPAGGGIALSTTARSTYYGVPLGGKCGKYGQTCRASGKCEHGTCKSESPVGGPCGGSTDAYCKDEGATCTDGRCSKESPLGGTCGADSGYTCAAGTECKNNLCQEESAAGGPCGGSTNSFCADGTRCESGKCAKESPVGGPCGGYTRTVCVKGSECQYNVCRRTY